MNKIYFGKYIELESPSIIHLLNPLIKLIIISIAATLIFYFGRNIYSYAFMTFLWLILIFLSGRIFKQAFSAIKSFKMLYIFIFVTMLLFGENGGFSIHFTKDALYTALLSTYQFVLIVAYSCLLTLTTSPSEIPKT
ncbi:MAG: energy-coupling factor transporter transmembrane protein EcfT, partial [Mucispirillum sp.]|nr:energy-coupling factor transporter transmembrane protein EcfT [Mucispirillum sp.]